MHRSSSRLSAVTATSGRNSRLTFDDKQKPHWLAADENGRRIVMNSGEYGEHRLFIVNFDPQAGTLQLDTRFRDPGSDRPGVSMDGKSAAGSAARPSAWRGVLPRTWRFQEK